MYKFGPLILSFILLLSCASPAEKFSLVADEFGFTDVLVNTTQFQHQLYVNALALQQTPKKELHVYIDGDGLPWKNKRWITDDPTSRNPIILKLMVQDHLPSLLLGRPCYHGLSQSQTCHFKHWTSHRYSEEVVTSLTAALTSWLQQHPVENITLIGFSGGGTLAVLIAPLVKNVTKVITIAANLDVAAWSQHHGYRSLEQSMNPVFFPLHKSLKQYHLVGESDAIVPTTTIKSYMKNNSSAELINFKNFNHHCCWVEAWPEIMKKVFHDE